MMQPKLKPFRLYSDIFDYIEAYCGLVFNEQREPEVIEAIEKHMKDLAYNNPQRFLEDLKSEKADITPLITLITVRETYFFRHREQLDYIRGTLIPQWEATHSQDELFRVWSAGCATGEEPYSIAILADQMSMGARFNILATDLCRSALFEAQEAMYHSWSFRTTDESFKEKYFIKKDKLFQLKPYLREKVNFQYLNLAENTFPSLLRGVCNIDLILCRNVLIYFEPPLIEKIAKRFYESLAPGGSLLTSATDPSLKQYAPFEAQVTAGGILYRKPDKGNGTLAAIPPAQSKNTTQPSLRIVPAPTTKSNEPSSPLKVNHTSLSNGSESLSSIAIDKNQPPRVIALAIEELASKKGVITAQTELSRALVLHPLSVELHYLNALLLSNQKKWQDTLNATEKLLYLDTNQPISHFLRACAAKQLHQFNEAKRSFRNALQLAQRFSPLSILPLTKTEYAGRFAKTCEEQLALLESIEINQWVASK